MGENLSVYKRGSTAMMHLNTFRERFLNLWPQQKVTGDTIPLQTLLDVSHSPKSMGLTLELVET